MVRAPNPIPADGNVECTDSMAIPIASTVGAVLTAGALVHAMTHLEDPDGREMLWMPLVGAASVDLLYAAAVGRSLVLECRDAKRRGTELAELARRKDAQANARADAGTLWKRAAEAARAEDCATVRELDPRIQELDVEFHAVVFARDVAIARCLADRE